MIILWSSTLDVLSSQWLIKVSPPTYPLKCLSLTNTVYQLFIQSKGLFIELCDYFIIPIWYMDDIGIEKLDQGRYRTIVS